MDREEIIRQDPDPTCSKCDRDAVAVDEQGNSLCARHATIFITLSKLNSAEAQHLATTGS